MTMTITEHEAADVVRANVTGLQPVVFVHGLWLLPNSWDRWARLFEDAGYRVILVGGDDITPVGLPPLCARVRRALR